MMTQHIDRLSLSQEDAETIVQKHLSGHTITKLMELKNNGFSYTAASKSYILDCQASNTLSGSSSSRTTCCFLTISALSQTIDSSDADDYHPNSLTLIQEILTRIRSHTDIPIPESILDTSKDIIPFPYLLSPASPFSSSEILPLRRAKEQGLLEPNHELLIDLQIGQLLGQLHNGVQNDWYGLPQVKDPVNPSYSWQETFTYLLESLLTRFQSTGYNLPYEDIKRYLSRAIAFYLFDDVEVPSLIWLTGSEDDIYIALPSRTSKAETPSIAAILPNVAHAMWGDPLAEVLFMPPAPSDALLEGYIGSGGGSLISFPRKKTKRIWYTLFLALIVLLERHESSLNDANIGFPHTKKQAWAEETIPQCVALLKDAPYY